MTLTVLGWLLSSLGAIGLCVAAITFVRGGYVQARLTDAEARVVALRGEITDYQREIAELKATEAKHDTRIKALEDENQLLRNLAVGKDTLETVATSLLEHHREAMRGNAEILRLLNLLNAKVDDNAGT